MESQITAGIPLTLDEANPSSSLGALYVAPDGIRRYRYARAGANLVVGNLLQGPTEDTADEDIAGTVQAIGTTALVTAAMTVTANQYAGGYVVVTVTPGLGTMYRIHSHAAFTGAAATFQLEEPLTVATTATTRLDFVANPFNGVLQWVATPTAVVTGVAVNDITSGQYGWIAVGGPASCLSDGGGIAVGAAVSGSNATAGAVETGVAGQAQIGSAMSGIAANENGLVWLNIS